MNPGRGTSHIDLSHDVEHGMETYPGLPGPVIGDHLTRQASRAHYAPGYEFHIGSIQMVGNTGTYLDVPFHRFPDGYGLEELPLDRVADVPGVCLDTPGPAIGPGVLDGVEIEDRAILFRTGWSRHWGTGAYGGPEHPYLEAATAARLAAAGPALVGIDSVNIDGTATMERPVHTSLLAAGIPIVEHLTGLERLDRDGFLFTAVPVKVHGLGSFPVRAFATVATA